MGVLTDNQQLLVHYGRIGQWIKERGDVLHAERIGEVLSELVNEGAATSVAFCGLFSAGKSSLINALCQSGDLATGAVPTTADVHVVTLPGTDGRVRLLDTPGVDSTDEAHREATMNALHRADVMVLVADYQHVEAEENLELLRAFSEEGKRIVFVVNQVDKHLDFELSFADFQEHVESSLDDYGIEVEHIYYTSTTASPHSELNLFRAWLCGLCDADGPSHLEQVKKRLDSVVRDAIRQLLGVERDAALDEVRAAFGTEPLDASELEAWLAGAKQELQLVEDEIDQAKQVQGKEASTLREAWVRTVELAQISPYETTEKGRLYVESLRPDFKVGFLRSGAKTAAEQARRAQAFLLDLNARLTNYLLVPLRSQVATDIRQVGWGKEEWVSQLDGLSLEVDVDYVRNLVKMGALVSSQYPYQYVKDVVSRVKRDILGQLGALVDRWFVEAEKALSDHQADKRHRIEAQLQKIDALRQVEDVMRKEEAWIQAFDRGEVPNE
ncbi:dynamin family protein [Alicyclobacillus fastidiosus]|uniref:Dynamin family protein n=1 Tax=Alicyclobacillus fastidiosus TaxID=392011 RepID=A0ABY6ZEE5_9BACL|nr:dynamin family protein [Alicyclobacillus fastidiosus]WAH40867.1 dynamin family protein [Alicyclobacillus fastidiosus]